MVKKYSLLVLFLFVLLFGFKGQSVNNVGRYLENVQGMVFVEGGTFILGQSDSDSTLSIFAQLADEDKQVSITSFYMDEGEVTNKQYREFVKWVRDSIAISNYLDDSEYFLPGVTSTDRLINWPKVTKGKSFWASRDESIKERLSSMFYQGEDRVFGRDELNVSLLKYNYEYFDLKAAAENKDKNLPRSAFIIRDTVLIYPDTLSWISDFEYAKNEAMAQSYFSNPAYDEYPVVGVTWKQANAFNNWRTKMLERELNSKKSISGSNLVFQLPTDAQWEYAARAGEKNTRYPWGNELCDQEDCLFANFKTEYGNYLNGNSNIVVPVYAFEANKFGLYNMAGNVAEWTSSSFDESSNIFVHDLNPDYSYDAKDTDPDALKRRVVRGGSWKDSEYFLRNSTKTFEYQDNPKSYIGFRSIVVVPGKQSGRKR